MRGKIGIKDELMKWYSGLGMSAVFPCAAPVESTDWEPLFPMTVSFFGTKQKENDSENHAWKKRNCKNKNSRCGPYHSINTINKHESLLIFLIIFENREKKKKRKKTQQAMVSCLSRSTILCWKSSHGSFMISHCATTEEPAQVNYIYC